MWKQGKKGINQHIISVDGGAAIWHLSILKAASIDFLSVSPKKVSNSFLVVETTPLQRRKHIDPATPLPPPGAQAQFSPSPLPKQNQILIHHGVISTVPFQHVARPCTAAAPPESSQQQHRRWQQLLQHPGLVETFPLPCRRGIRERWDPVRAQVGPGRP